MFNRRPTCGKCISSAAGISSLWASVSASSTRMKWSSSSLLSVGKDTVEILLHELMAHLSTVSACCRSVLTRQVFREKEINQIALLKSGSKLHYVLRKFTFVSNKRARCFRIYLTLSTSLHQHLDHGHS